MINFYLIMLVLAIGLFTGVFIGFRAADSQYKEHGFRKQKKRLQVQNPFIAGTKVIAMPGHWPTVSGLVLHMPKPGNVYVVRASRIMPDHTITVQLIGVTEIVNGIEEEPYWDSQLFKLHIPASITKNSHGGSST
jgi:uncharacterized protein YneF (UPF0154 family)